MRITIIPIDGAVYKGEYSFTHLNLSFVPQDIHALQFNTANNNGWIEFKEDDFDNKKPNQPINELPDWANECLELFQEKWDEEHKPQPEPDPIVLCKAKAVSLLSQTDWSELPSVSDPANNPHLLNTSEFLTYRAAIRALAVNPVADPVFPTVPTAQWSN